MTEATTAETTDDDGAAGLILRVARGDRGALAELFRREAGLLLGVARRIVRRPDLAEEVVQETFVAIWTRAAQFDRARGTARGWMTTMARNRALNVIRDGSRIDYVDGGELADLGDRSGEADLAFRTLPERDALRRCLEVLEAERRRAILLAYVTGLTHGEIAAEMRTPLGTVKAWIRRGTIALQECLS